jgi:TM2 domain-containing membrane protein YozV
MFCRNCGKEVDEKAVVCVSCGVPPKNEKKFCGNCGVKTEENQAMCVKCGVAFASPSTGFSGLSGEKSKMVAGILGIIFGAIGGHKFYLGYNKEGVIMLLITLISFFTLAVIPSLIGLIEGIMYLMKSEEEFKSTYVDSKKGWF